MRQLSSVSANQLGGIPDTAILASARFANFGVKGLGARVLSFVATDFAIATFTTTHGNDPLCEVRPRGSRHFIESF